MRLIDIEDVALLKTVTDGGLSAKKLWRRINNQPTVDAVPVVRCEQCTWWNMGECMFWAGDGMYTEYYDYCSRGKRKVE